MNNLLNKNEPKNFKPVKTSADHVDNNPRSFISR